MGEWVYKNHVFLISTLPEVKCSASRPGRLTPEGRASGTHRIGGWVHPRTGLNNVERKKTLPQPGLELQTLGRPARSQSLRWLVSAQEHRRADVWNETQKTVRLSVWSLSRSVSLIMLSTGVNFALPSGDNEDWKNGTVQLTMSVILWRLPSLNDSTYALLRRKLCESLWEKDISRPVTPICRDPNTGKPKSSTDK
jgi:hypothetical protein